MDNDRNNRNDWNERDYRGGSDSDRNSRGRQDGNSGRDQGGREDYARRDYGGGSDFYGANRDDYGMRGSSRGDAGGSYGAGRSGGGYDEWSRRGTRAFGDQSYGGEASRGAFGDNDRSYGDRGYGGSGSRGSGRDDSFYGGQSAGGERWSSGRSYGGGERGAAEGGRGFWDKASDEVSSWFGDRGAERRREADQHRGRGPKGYTRSDERIRDDINDRLTDDGWVDASDIEVNVSNREVTLTGTVGDRNAKRRAEDIAEGISGVSHVQNNLRVKSKDVTGTDVDVDRTDAAAGIVKAGAGGMR